MRRSIISSERSRSGKRRSASALRRTSSGVGGLPPGGDDAHALEHHLRHVVGHRDARTRCRGPRTTSACARLRLPSRPRRARAPRTDRAAGARSRCRRCDSSKCDCRSSTLHRADHRAEALDGADARQRRDRRLAHALAEQVLRLRDVREDLGPRARAARRGSRCRTAPGATAATPRSPARGCSVRGETYAPFASKPPWQRTPPATSGSTTSCPASSSRSVHVSWTSIIAGSVEAGGRSRPGVRTRARPPGPGGRRGPRPRRVCSAVITARNDVIATSSWSRSGSRVVSLCSNSPGRTSTRTQRRCMFLAAKRITS